MKPDLNLCPACHKLFHIELLPSGQWLVECHNYKCPAPASKEECGISDNKQEAMEELWDIIQTQMAEKENLID